MAKIEIRGNADLRKAIRRFTPDLEKQLVKELGLALRPVVKKAKGYIPITSPMSGWAARPYSEARFPFFNYSTIARNIVYSTAVSKPNKNGFTSMARIVNRSPIGAIYETAGAKTIYETAGAKNPNGQPWVGSKAGGTSKGVSRSVNPGAGATFIANLDPITSSLKGRGRLIYRAWANSKGVAEGAAMKAIDKATRSFYDRNKKQTFKKAS
jgi:hypothetical protein